MLEKMYTACEETKSPVARVNRKLVTEGINVSFLSRAKQMKDYEVIIPSGSFTFMPKDKIYITANNRSTLRTFLDKSGVQETKIKSVMIVGGGKISAYLGKELLQNKFDVKILEENHERCKELSALLPKATIICGDGTDQEVLEEEGLDNTDAIVCLTGSDEENIIVKEKTEAYVYQFGMKLNKLVAEMQEKDVSELPTKYVTELYAAIDQVTDMLDNTVIDTIETEDAKRRFYDICDVIEAYEMQEVKR
mgnify:CR=1 FL=1